MDVKVILTGTKFNHWNLPKQRISVHYEGYMVGGFNPIWKNMLVKLGSFPQCWGWNHHRSSTCWCSMLNFWVFPSTCISQCTRNSVWNFPKCGSELSSNNGKPLTSTLQLLMILKTTALDTRFGFNWMEAAKVLKILQNWWTLNDYLIGLMSSMMIYVWAMILQDINYI